MSTAAKHTPWTSEYRNNSDRSSLEGFEEWWNVINAKGERVAACLDGQDRITALSHSHAALLAALEDALPYLNHHSAVAEQARAAIRAAKGE